MKKNVGHKRVLLDNGMIKHTWQNPGMRNQPIFEYLTYANGKNMNDAVGDITAYTYDKKWAFEVRDSSEAVSAKIHIKHEDKCNDVEIFPYALCEDMDVSSTWHGVVLDFNDVWDDGYVYVWNEDVMNVISCISELFELGWHVSEWQDRDNLEEGWFICNDDVWHQLHFDEDAYFVFREDVIDRVCAEVNGTCDRVWQKVAMQYPNGEIDFTEGYVVIGDHCGYDCN